MAQDYITFGSPKYSKTEVAEVVDSLENSWIGTGPKVKAFEEAFAEYLGVEDCVAVNSCTAALHLSLLEANVKHGDEVITTSMTFCSTVNTIIHVGATPVLVDISSIDWNIQVEEIENKISPKTKAVVVVHFAGRPCNIEALDLLVKKYDLILIEDCAHAIETKIGDRHVGTFGDFAAFSFYSTKNISSGEGGMVIAKKGKKALDNIRQRALHGMDKDAYKRYTNEGVSEYDVKAIGYKYNMMDIQAAIAIHQLKNIKTWHTRRQVIWHEYCKEFLNLPLVLPAVLNPNETHAFHLYQILLDTKKFNSESRFKFRLNLHNDGIGTGVHYKSIPSFSIYQKIYNWDPNEWPNSKLFGEKTISIPNSPHLTDSEVERIIHSVKRAIKDV